jgi:hypothetical protein
MITATEQHSKSKKRLAANLKQFSFALLSERNRSMASISGSKSNPPRTCARSSWRLRRQPAPSCELPA